VRVNLGIKSAVKKKKKKRAREVAINYRAKRVPRGAKCSRRVFARTAMSD